MATAKSRKTKKTEEITDANGFFKMASLVMTKVGITGFVCISMVFYIFLYIPDAQKQELTNTWLLFKCKDCNNLYIFVALTLVVAFLFQNYFYRKTTQLKEERIKEITKEKSELQQALIHKKLKSSGNES